MNLSPLQKARYEYVPKLPGMLRHGIAEIAVKKGEATTSVADQEKIAELFPNTYGEPEVTFEKGQNTSAAKKQVVGVILSGGQAPGGHNVVSGLYDALKATNKETVLIGFKGGPSGLIEDNFIVFDDAATVTSWKMKISITNNIFETKLKYISIFLCNLGQNFCRRNTLPTNITISDHDYIPSVLFQFFTYSNHIFCHILEVGIYNGCTFCINFSDFFHNRDNCF